MASTSKDATSPAKKKKGVLPVFSIINSYLVAGEWKYVIIYDSCFEENPRQALSRAENEARCAMVVAGSVGGAVVDDVPPGDELSHGWCSWWNTRNRVLWWSSFASPVVVVMEMHSEAKKIFEDSTKAGQCCWRCSVLYGLVPASVPEIKVVMLSEVVVAWLKYGRWRVCVCYTLVVLCKAGLDGLGVANPGRSLESEC